MLLRSEAQAQVTTSTEQDYNETLTVAAVTRNIMRLSLGKATSQNPGEYWGKVQPNLPPLHH